MTEPGQIIIIGAGILGLASAYHILQENCALELLVIERLPGPARGNTARSAAGFRDIFSSPLNRALSRGSLAFYDQVHHETDIGLKRIGYLWLKTAAQMKQYQGVLEAMAAAGVEFETLAAEELSRLLPELQSQVVVQGILGRNCGILNPHLLCRFYEKKILALGGKFAYGVEVTGFAIDSQGQIIGVKLGEKIKYGAIVVATGAWINRTMSLADLNIPVTPRKRQLFAVTARESALSHLLQSRGFSADSLLPLTIMPGGAYLRPSSGAFILGYANPDQPAGLEDHPTAAPHFFENRVRPQVAQYFPSFREVKPQYAWAGHYADHLADRHPIVDRLGGAIVVGGPSGSGIMKADALGRIAAGLYFGQDQVELADGGRFQLTDLGLTDRKVMPEKLAI
jgi:glycine/D-amino acid oxidase-like deaminating enzyme